MQSVSPAVGLSVIIRNGRTETAGERSGMDKESQSMRWISGSAVPSFVLQQIISTVGAVLVGIIASLILAALTAAFTKNTSGGNFGDRMVDQPVFKGVGQPYYLMLVLAGFILGALSRRFFRTRGAAGVWVLPLCILLWNIFTWKTGGYGTYWQGVWDNYFGSNCPGSECLYEFFVTVPFYTSIAYSLGWLVWGLVASKTKRTV